MKTKLILSAVTALLAGVSAASAADLAARPYTKAPMAPMVAVYNWTGFYIGVNGGYGWSQSDFVVDTVPATLARVKGTGGVFGGQIGYNWQTGPLVLGLEGEYAWADITKDGVDCTFAQTALCSNKIDGLGSVRGRLGYAANNALFFVSGGWGVAHARYDRVFQPGGVPFTSGVTKTESGFAAGVGVEYGFTNNWIGRLQYDYYGFGRNNYALDTLSNTSTASVETNVQVVRAGISYKFGGPVVAKY